MGQSQNKNRVLTYFHDRWYEGNPAIVGPMTHGFWVSSIVFDGARAFQGMAPDLDLHCERLVRSAATMGLRATLRAPAIYELCKEGISHFPSDTELYIRPMFYSEEGWVDPAPESTQFVLCVYESALPRGGFSACLSSRRRPSPCMAPTDAKASCLYPNVGLALKEARARGFQSAIMLDPLGNVAEFAIANLFIAKDGVVHTPVPNGTFLAGITRQRVIQLLRDGGVTVHERTLRWEEVVEADEVFSAGNYAKVAPLTQLEDRELEPGPIYERARSLYWEFAHRGATERKQISITR